MPIEIRELVVKITVEDSKPKQELSDFELAELKKKIIKECVDKVLTKLENQLQR